MKTKSQAETEIILRTADQIKVLKNQLYWADERVSLLEMDVKNLLDDR